MIEEQPSESLRISFRHSLGETGYNALGRLLSIAIGGDIDTQGVGSRQRVVILEVIHKVVGDRFLHPVMVECRTLRLDVNHRDNIGGRGVLYVRCHFVYL